VPKEKFDFVVPTVVVIFWRDTAQEWMIFFLDATGGTPQLLTYFLEGGSGCYIHG
jgi:hypothetical protein